VKICETKKIMGGHFSIFAWTTSEQEAERIRSAIAEGFNQISLLEDKLTDFRPSPFNRINEWAGIHPVAVDQETFDLIEHALLISKDTDGAFDISYASVGQLWRSARQSGILPNVAEIEAKRRYVDYRLIQLNRRELTVYLPYKDMKIGLGGIGKGHAVDKFYQFLRQQNISNFMVNGAGDVRVHSQRDAPRPWRLQVRNPFSEDIKKSMGVVQLANGAMATSGDYINYVKSTESLQRKYHHIIDPKLGFPTNEIVSCTVMAPTAIVADTIATSVIVMNLKMGLKYLNQKKFIGFVVTKDGVVHLSTSAFDLMNKGSTCSELSSS
jgi:thiamine biosynthesis lipoprotein